MPTPQRSPRFPSIPIEKTLDPLQRLFTAVHRSKFLLEDAASALKYSPASGSLRVILGALRQYGLITGKVGKPNQITDLGLLLAINDPSSTEFFEALQEAFLFPSLFRTVHDMHGDLADSALKARLMLEHKFSEQGAAKFIHSYRSTLRFVEQHRPTESDILVEDRDDSLDNEIAEGQSSSRESTLVQSASTEASNPSGSRLEQTEREVNVIPLQLIGGESMVTIHLPKAMSASAWDQMMAMLAALRPGYVQAEEMVGVTKQEAKE